MIQPLYRTFMSHLSDIQEEANLTHEASQRNLQQRASFLKWLCIRYGVDGEAYMDQEHHPEEDWAAFILDQRLQSAKQSKVTELSWSPGEGPLRNIDIKLAISQETLEYIKDGVAENEESVTLDIPYPDKIYLNGTELTGPAQVEFLTDEDPLLILSIAIPLPTSILP